ncbi:LamG domain-containing protein [Candidatus Poribacteria bacterium]|nr:LamG domain-containing protein [Candidatus Poribacteria bacterium]
MKTVTIISFVVLLTILTVAFVKAETLALWLFDERQGDVAKDSSGNGNDGKINGAKYVTGKYGTALKFEGDDFVDIGLPKSLQEGIVDAFTAETWVKADKAPPADHSTIIFMQVGGPIAIGFTSSTGGGFYGYAGGASKITDPDKFAVGEWVHVAQTYDGTNQKLFRNGVEIASQKAPGAITHTENAWTIGAWSTHDQYFLEASLDELHVLNEALPPKALGFYERRSPVEPTGKLTATWCNLKVGY